MWDTNKMEYERGCSVKMCLVEEVVAEAGQADTDRMRADSCWPSSGPPVRERGEVEAAEAAGHTGHNLLCTVDSSQLHQDKQACSVVAEAAHSDHRGQRHSGAGVDTGERSVGDNDHIGVDAGVDAGGVEEARLTDTAYGMGAVEEDAWDALVVVGEPSNGEEVGAEVDG